MRRPKWLPVGGPTLALHATGDLGFFDNGELFVTGRLKDLIIVRGRNHYPQDLDFPWRRRRRSCAPDRLPRSQFDHDGRERVVIVAELERGRRDRSEILAAMDAIRSRLARGMKWRSKGSCFVRPNSIPKTSSGKIQRHACRRQFLDGTLDVVEQHVAWLAPAAPETAIEATATPRLARQRPLGESTAPTVPTASFPRRSLQTVFEHVRRIAKERAGNLTLDTIHRGARPRFARTDGDRGEPGRGVWRQVPEQVLRSSKPAARWTEAIIDHMPAESREKVQTSKISGEVSDRCLADRGVSRGSGTRAELLRWSAMRGSRIPTSVSTRVSRTTARRSRGGNSSVGLLQLPGNAGDPAVTAAAKAAIDRFGTSVSASRLVSGEKTIHGELERAIANLVGAEDAITFVGGHATNETVIGHVVGPGDLVLHDAFAHNSLLQGAILSGARVVRSRTTMSPRPRRFSPGHSGGITAVCSSWSRASTAWMADYADLPKFVGLEKRNKSLLMVDEAHSIGVMGPTGRGIGEHFVVAAKDVDLWMGTLSKAFGSCGGYIAGSSALVRWLK